MGEMRNVYKILVGKPNRKSLFRRHKRRWEDNIKMCLKEIGYWDKDWIGLRLGGINVISLEHVVINIIKALNFLTS